MAPSEGRVAGKRALVTGAASGIGRASAQLLVEEGARVVGADVNGAALKEALAGLEGRAMASTADISSKNDVERLVTEAVRWLGGLDILVNSAGVSGVGDPKRLAELSDESWQKTIGVNLTGTFLVCRAALPHLAATGGAIVNLASTYAVFAGPKLGAYSASKAGIVQLTKNVAVDYAAQGVRANALAPGWVDTPMLRDDIAGECDPEGALRSIVARIPQGELMTAEQVARVVLFLASDDAQIVTGSLLIADGGYTALGGGGAG